MSTEFPVVEQNPHDWSFDALFSKAQRYAEEMHRHSSTDWQHVLWSTLALELLARAVLARRSPALLADLKDWNHVYFALGFEPIKKKYAPRSLDISSVFDRLQNIYPEFTPELERFCISHLSKRNAELHSGNNVFDDLKSDWQARYFKACKILLEIAEKDLTSFFGSARASAMDAAIVAASDESAKSVSKKIAAFSVTWGERQKEERELLSTKAAAWATKQDGHRTICPACHSDALISGVPIAAPIKTISGDEIIETQDYQPANFECVACDLKISGLSQLTASGLGGTYKGTFRFDAVDYYVPDDPYEGYEPDFNEYGAI